MGLLFCVVFFSKLCTTNFFFPYERKMKKRGRKFNKTGRIYFLYAIYTFLKLAILHECNFRYTFVKYIHLKKKNSLIISVTRPVSDVSHGSLVLFFVVFFFQIVHHRVILFLERGKEKRTRKLFVLLWWAMWPKLLVWFVIKRDMWSGDLCGPRHLGYPKKDKKLIHNHIYAFV